MRCLSVDGGKECRRSGRLGTVVALHDDAVDGRHRPPQGDRGLVLGRMPAIERGLVRGEFDDDVAAAAHPLDDLVAAGTDEKARAVLGERDAVRRDVALVDLDVGNVDACDPVTLGHTTMSLSLGRYGRSRDVLAMPAPPPPRPRVRLRMTRVAKLRTIGRTQRWLNWPENHR